MPPAFQLLEGRVFGSMRLSDLWCSAYEASAAAKANRAEDRQSLQHRVLVLLHVLPR